VVDVWVPVVAVVVGAALGYLGHWLRARTPTKDNDRTLADARRSADLETYRWAALLALSEDEGERSFGTKQLRVLVRSPNLLREDLRLVSAAIESALGPRLQAWETETSVEPPTDATLEEER
jgi:hypothetical protein